MAFLGQTILGPTVKLISVAGGKMVQSIAAAMIFKGFRKQMDGY